MDVKIKVIFLDEKGSFMGVGLSELLGKTDSMSSIRKAAKSMGLSYPKAIRIIQRLEEALGKSVIERHRGGKGGGGAKLTDFGREFLEKYDKFREKINNYAQKTFNEDFFDF